MLLRKFSDCFHALVKATYDYMLNLASRRNAMYFLFAVAFIESSFFPIPPDVMLIPMVLAAAGESGGLPALRRPPACWAVLSAMLSAFSSLI